MNDDTVNKSEAALNEITEVLNKYGFSHESIAILHGKDGGSEGGMLIKGSPDEIVFCIAEACAEVDLVRNVFKDGLKFSNNPKCPDCGRRHPRGLLLEIKKFLKWLVTPIIFTFK